LRSEWVFRGDELAIIIELEMPISVWVCAAASSGFRWEFVGPCCWGCICD